MPDPEKVFKVEREGETLIIMPQGAALKFQYQKVHLESNYLIRILDEPEIRNAVVDLGSVNYVDSIIISAILRVLTKTRQAGGKAVFCNASDDMQDVLKCIKIGKLWPLYASREEALQSMRASASSGPDTAPSGDANSGPTA